MGAEAPGETPWVTLVAHVQTIHGKVTSKKDLFLNLEIYTDRIECVRKSAGAWVFKSAEQRTIIRYDQIAHINFKKARMWATPHDIEIFDTGGVQIKCSNVVIGQSKHDDKEINIDDIERFIMEHIAISRQPRVSAQSVPQDAADVPGLIEGLSRLRDNGILTEEEFQTKKQELLKRL
jgi:hypothetical protein